MKLKNVLIVVKDMWKWHSSTKLVEFFCFCTRLVQFFASLNDSSIDHDWKMID